MVSADRLRFDFTYPSPLSHEQIRKVEQWIRQAIQASVPVTTVEMDLEKAKQSGAMSLFNEKYGSTVRVVEVWRFLWPC